MNKNKTQKKKKRLKVLEIKTNLSGPHKKTKYDTKVTKINNKIQDILSFVKKKNLE